MGTYFVPKFNHEQRTGFMSTFRYIGKVQTNGKPSEYGRVFYIYEPTTTQKYTISDSTLQWIFPDKYSKTIGLSVGGFKFTFPNLIDSLKNLLELSSGLINKERGTKETSSVPTEALFFSKQMSIEDAIKKFGKYTGSLLYK